MKRTCMALLLTLLLFVSVSAAQNALVSSPVRTEVYRIHFVKAAIGKVNPPRQIYDAS